MEPSPQISDMKQVKCPSCGATLSYKPGTTSQVCEYCHSTFEIASEQELVQAAKAEIDLQTALAGEWQQAQAGGQALVVKCPSCGAETALGTSMFSGSCTFCGSVLTVKPNTKAVANPQAVLPFKLERPAAQAVYQRWLGKLWFAPNDLKNTAAADRFNGVYLPFWTFDANTATVYQGQRGDHYTENVRQIVDGKPVIRQVVKTRWMGVRGRVSRLFNDILVTASRALPGKYLNSLEPWDLTNLTNYDPRYLSGFQAEVSQVDIREGFEAAKGVMGSVIRQDIHRDIGGDEQRITGAQTSFSNTTYKYVLLPVWLSVFRYGDKVYRFVVNARTGEVLGERPYSAIKIALAVVVALIFLCLAVMVVSLLNQ